MRKLITVLGATGTVGSKALEIIRKNQEKFHIVGISGHSNVTLLARFALEFTPKYVVVSNLHFRTELEQ